MASIIKASINLNEIPKDKIIVGKKGKYLPIKITINDEPDRESQTCQALYLRWVETQADRLQRLSGHRKPEDPVVQESSYVGTKQNPGLGQKSPRERRVSEDQESAESLTVRNLFECLRLLIWNGAQRSPGQSQ